MEKLLKYLIQFLLGDSNSNAVGQVGYTADEKTFEQYKVVVIPSPFFADSFYGTKESLPPFSPDFIENIPLLYGKNLVETRGKTLVVHADIIASSYFLLSRYEEWIRQDCRDEHGRFSGKESIAYKSGFLHRPIVDEYGRLLRKWLRETGLNNIEEPKNEIRQIYLTHDVDIPFRYRTFRTLAGSLVQSLRERKNHFSTAINTFRGDINSDPFFTFPWILEQNRKLAQETKTPTSELFFFKSGKKILPQDRPTYDLGSKDIRQLITLIKENGGKIGLHSSYFSGDFPEVIPEEKKMLEEAIGDKITCNRHHYLRSKEPMDMQYLIYTGITDDFTLGYADVAGFRLGTSRAVKWIDVSTKLVSDLNLHPTILMDCSLSEEKYMNLSYEDAFEYAKNLIDKVREFNGELVLLWHNSSFCHTNSFDHRKLYSSLLAELTT